MLFLFPAVVAKVGNIIILHRPLQIFQIHTSELFGELLPHIIWHLQVLSQPLLWVTCWPTWQQARVWECYHMTECSTDLAPSVCLNMSHCWQWFKAGPETAGVYLNTQRQCTGNGTRHMTAAQTRGALWLIGTNRGSSKLIRAETTANTVKANLTQPPSLCKDRVKAQVPWKKPGLDAANIEIIFCLSPSQFCRTTVSCVTLDSCVTRITLTAWSWGCRRGCWPLFDWELTQ